MIGGLWLAQAWFMCLLPGLGDGKSAPLKLVDWAWQGASSGTWGAATTKGNRCWRGQTSRCPHQGPQGGSHTGQEVPTLSVRQVPKLLRRRRLDMSLIFAWKKIPVSSTRRCCSFPGLRESFDCGVGMLDRRPAVFGASVAVEA